MIGAVVLAAGASSRMGTQKLLLPYAGSTVIRHIVDQLRESRVEEILVVTGHDHKALVEHLSTWGVTLVHNQHYAEGMLSSVRAGLAAAPESWQAAMIVLGDQPALRLDTINRLALEQARNPVHLVVPVASGRRGHPLVVPMAFRDDIMSQFDEVGLRGLLQRHAGEVIEIGIDSTTILEDIDYPEDYQQALRERERES